MAIKKQKVLDSDVSGEYWKITKEEYDRLTGKISWYISLFKNQEASNANKAPLNKEYKFNSTITNVQAQGNRIALGYSFIKSKAEEQVPNIDGNGTHTYNSDLANGEDV